MRAYNSDVIVFMASLKDHLQLDGASPRPLPQVPKWHLTTYAFPYTQINSRIEHIVLDENVPEFSASMPKLKLFKCICEHIIQMS